MSIFRCQSTWPVLLAAIVTSGAFPRAEEPPAPDTQSALRDLKQLHADSDVLVDSKPVDQAAEAKDESKDDPKSDVLFAVHGGSSNNGEPLWNFHMQNTDIVQGDPGFPAKYAGKNSLRHNGEIEQTVTLDLFGGVRLWNGAELHVDGLMWQGYGLSKSFGIEDFPNGDAFKAGTEIPNFTFARLFVRQTIGLGGEQEDVPDDQLTLPGKQDVSRVTITFGKFSPEDIIDNNAYAHDQHTQFMNWSLMGNTTFDYGQDTLGCHCLAPSNPAHHGQCNAHLLRRCDHLLETATGCNKALI